MRAERSGDPPAVCRAQSVQCPEVGGCDGSRTCQVFHGLAWMSVSHDSRRLGPNRPEKHTHAVGTKFEQRTAGGEKPGKNPRYFL